MMITIMMKILTMMMKNIDRNNEYYIVKQKVAHGITVYDRIILDADKYEPNEMIY